MAGKHVFKENTFTTLNSVFSDGGSVTVETDAYVVPVSGTGIVLNPATWNVVVNGAINCVSGGVTFATNVASVGNSKLTVGGEGSIVAYGASTDGIKMGVPVDITNAGLIQGTDIGIFATTFGPTSSKGFTIANGVGGEITGSFLGIANTSTIAMTVKNMGEITGGGAIEWSGALTLVNGGSIHGDLLSGNTFGTFTSSITNNNRLDGDIFLSDGDDTLKNTGLLIGGVSFHEGNNKITNSGAILAALVAGSGNNTLTNSGSLDTVTFGDGKNTVTNTGTMLSLTLGDGVNTVKNSGSIDGVNLGDGGNSFTNSGDVIGVTGGAGTDTVKNTGTITAINLKGGDDTFIGGNKSEVVSDDLGNDTYKFGGGDDRILLASGNDVCDGGAGSDEVDMFGVPTICFINLDTKAVTLANTNMLANTMVTAGVAASIKNFEEVLGGASLDLINGTAGANVLRAGAGDDYLAGGLGADELAGNSDDDHFVYFSIKDSGVAKATRDTITDFEGDGVAGGDLIDLSAIDTNTKLANDQGFTWLGNNVAFSAVGGAAELRAVNLGNDTVVQGDVNGDGKTDFAITVTGIKIFAADDFVL